MGRKERLFFHHIGDLSSVLTSPGCFLPHEIFGPDQPGIGEAVLAVLRRSWNQVFFRESNLTDSCLISWSKTSNWSWLRSLFTSLSAEEAWSPSHSSSLFRTRTKTWSTTSSSFFSSRTKAWSTAPHVNHQLSDI